MFGFPNIACAEFVWNKSNPIENVELGTPCWKEIDEDSQSYKLYKCTGAENFYDQNFYYCSSSYKMTLADDGMLNGLHCLAAVKGNSFYVCSEENGVNGRPCEDIYNMSWQNATYSEVDWDLTDGRYCYTYNEYTAKLSEKCWNSDECWEYAMIKGPLIEYCRCDKGYYMSSGNATDGAGACSRCPSFNGVAGQTNLWNLSSISDCCLPAGTAFSDDTGSGNFYEKCCY